MIDKLPEYEGEKKVWDCFSKNLPQQYVVYNVVVKHFCNTYG